MLRFWSTCKLISSLAISLSLSACTDVLEQVESIEKSPVSLSTVKSPSQVQLACPEVANVKELLSSEKPIIIVGEVHGYIEPPKLVEALICHSLEANYKTLVSVEISKDRAQDLYDYVVSSGDSRAKRKILADSRWLSLGDGRQTQATFDILELVRIYKKRGDAVSISNYVPDNLTLASIEKSQFSADYERLLAENIMENFRYEMPDKMIVLAGNLHAKNGEGRFAGKVYPLMASYMDSSQFISLNMSIDNDSMAIKLFDSAQEGYDGEYTLPDLTSASAVKSPYY